MRCYSQLPELNFKYGWYVMMAIFQNNQTEHCKHFTIVRIPASFRPSGPRTEAQWGFTQCGRVHLAKNCCALVQWSQQRC